VLSAIGFWIFDLKYWPILSIVAAVMSLIPIFGSILSSIPAVAIGLTQSPGIAFGVLMWIIGIHQLEANFLNPKIIGDAAKIHPVLVVFSLLVGEHFFQITGALFAVPCMSIAQTVFLHFRESTMGVPDPSASIPPQPSRLSLRTPLPGSVGPPSQPLPPPPAPPPPAPPPPDEPVPDTARAGGG
jgi:predicted PurR-regulated permease PerM